MKNKIIYKYRKRIKWLKNCLSGLTFVTFTVIFFDGCKNHCEKVADLPTIPVNVVRLEKRLFNLKSVDDVQQLLNKYPSFSEKYFSKSSYPDDSLLATSLFKFYSNKELNTLKQSTDSTFGNLKSLTPDLENLLSHVKYYYPDFFIPTVYTLVSGFQFDKDLIVSDSIIAISLDYFLGRKAKFRPAFYNYILERYEKEYIVPMISLGISNKFNTLNEKDETMVANMIYYGKAYYFAKEMMPCVDDSLIIQYSGVQIQEVSENLRVIWGHFIENKLLFETKPQVIDKYLGERPKVNEIGDKCPGRIGRWLGMKIVEKYMAEKKVTLQQLMEENDAQKIFTQSRFKPD